MENTTHINLTQMWGHFGHETGRLTEGSRWMRNLPISPDEIDEMERASEENLHLVIGNFQVVDDKDSALGEFEVPERLALPKPDEEAFPQNQQLLFWVKKITSGVKNWVALDEIERNGKDYGIALTSKTRRADWTLEPGKKQRVIYIEITRWPVDDIIISWEG